MIPSKDNYINSFSTFITDVKEHAATYTQDDWNKADLRFYKYTEQDCLKYQTDFPEDDKEILGRLKNIAFNKIADKSFVVD